MGSKSGISWDISLMQADIREVKKIFEKVQISTKSSFKLFYYRNVVRINIFIILTTFFIVSNN